MGDFPKIEHIVNTLDRAEAMLLAAHQLDEHVECDVASHIDAALAEIRAAREAAATERDETLGGPVTAEWRDQQIDVGGSISMEGTAATTVKRGDG